MTVRAVQGGQHHGGLRRDCVQEGGQDWDDFLYLQLKLCQVSVWCKAKDLLEAGIMKRRVANTKISNVEHKKGAAKQNNYILRIIDDSLEFLSY